jgi:phage terminase small subunit
VKTAQEQASRLLSNVIIQAAMQEAMAERSSRVLVTADDVLSSIMLLRKMAIDSDRISEGLKANELLGKHIALFTDKLDATITMKELPPVSANEFV